MAMSMSPAQYIDRLRVATGEPVRMVYERKDGSYFVYKLGDHVWGVSLHGREWREYAYHSPEPPICVARSLEELCAAVCELADG